jgi:hypothetical protein
VSSLIIPAAIIIITVYSVGRLTERAHDAHRRFTSYRHRTNAELGVWLKDSVLATLAWLVILVMVFVVYLVNNSK